MPQASPVPPCIATHLPQTSIINQLMCTCENLGGQSAMASSSGPASSTSSSFASTLHAKRGVGYSSRFRVSETRLPSGWRREQKSLKYTVWYDDKGKRYKSSVEVERVLKERGLLRMSARRKRRLKLVARHQSLSLPQSRSHASQKCEFIDHCVHKVM